MTKFQGNEQLSAACPACEYERGTRGEPVSDHGEMHCLSCGNRWKQFSDNQVSQGGARLNLATKDAEDRDFGIDNGDDLSSSPGIRLPDAPKSGMGQMLTGVLILVACVTGAIYQMSVTPNTQAGLHVSDVSFEELVRNDSEKVVKIRGTIANAGSKREIVPRVALVLKQANGEELITKFYQSPVKIMAPGAKTQFVTSFLYDTPFIASVEAMLE